MAASLRSFRPGDHKPVLELSRRALTRPQEQVGNPVWASQDELESELAGWDRPPEETLFVEDDEDRVVGFGGVEVPVGWEHADLFGPLVAVEYRGRRIGRRLLQASIEAGRKRGATRIVALLGTRNTKGRILLERSGFRALAGARAVFRLSPTSHRPVRPQPGLRFAPANLRTSSPRSSSTGSASRPGSSLSTFGVQDSNAVPSTLPTRAAGYSRSSISTPAIAGSTTWA